MNFTPRFENKTTFQTHSRAKAVIDALRVTPEAMLKVLRLLTATQDPDYPERAVRLMITMQYYTAKYGGIHCIELTKYAKDLDLTPNMFEVWLLHQYEADNIKLNPDLLTFSWRVTELNKPGIESFEQTLALQVKREPVDFFASGYIRQYQKPTGFIANPTLAAEAEAFFREDYAPYVAHGLPLSNPDDFFL